MFLGGLKELLATRQNPFCLKQLMISPHLTKLPALWLDGKLAGVPDTGRGGWWVHYGAGSEGHFFLICCYTSVPRTEPGMWELIFFQMLLIIKKIFENLDRKSFGIFGPISMRARKNHAFPHPPMEPALQEEDRQEWPP